MAGETLTDTRERDHVIRKLAVMQPVTTGASVSSDWVYMGPYRSNANVEFRAEDVGNITATAAFQLMGWNGADSSVTTATAGVLFGVTITTVGLYDLDSLPSHLRVLNIASSTTCATITVILVADK